MKLKKIVRFLTEAKDDIYLESILDSKPVNVTKAPERLFKNLDIFRAALEKISITGVLEPDINKFKDTALFKTGKDEYVLNSGEAHKIDILSANLISNFDSVFSSLKSSIPEEKENSISIKLPPTGDFEELSNVSSNIHKILSQTILDKDIDGKIEITGVENGSIWIDVFLGSTAAVTLVGGMVWSAAVIYKKITEARIMETQLKGLKLRADSFSEIVDKQSVLLKHMITAESEMLIDENYKDKKPEQVERMKHSIKLLADIIDKGGEIHPSLSAPESVSNLFPVSGQFKTIESKVLKLKKGDEQNDLTNSG